MTEESIFYQALEKTDPEARAAFLKTTCSDNGELRRRIEALLSSHEGAGSFLKPPALNSQETVDVAPGSAVGDTDEGRSGRGAAPLLEPSHGFLGDYELGGEIARGGMGVVYRARQVSVNRPVALKMILAGSLADAREVQRFRAEAEAAATLDHPNIVPIYEVGEHEGQHYFSMKLIQGTSLNECLARFVNEPLQTAKVMETVARAVHHAHERGILHRDLKPGNILLDQDGQPYVTDFGLAKRIDAPKGMTQSGAIVGTPEYLAPEQAAGQKALTTAADVYGLGSILYALMTGTPPFRRPNLLETLQDVVHSEPVKPSKLQPRAPRDLETICLKCLNKNPRNRYGSSEELAEDLRRFQANEPILARPVGQFERVWRWRQRNPMVSGLLALVVLLLFAGSGISIYFAIEAEKKAASEKRRADAEREAKEDLAQQKQATDKALAEAEIQRARAERGEADAKATAYGLQMELIRQAITRGDFPQASAQLAKTDPKLRGWEHDFLLRQVNVTALKLLGHSDHVTCVAFSPDGGRIVSGSNDRTVRIWDAVSGKALRTLKGHTGSVRGVAFSPDGKRIVSGSFDATLKIWDADTGEERFTLKAHKTVRSVCLSADGKQIVSGAGDMDSNGEIRVWDATTGKEQLTIPVATGVYSVAISPDGSRIVSRECNDPKVKVWDAGTGKLVKSLPDLPSLSPVALFSPDGKHFVSTGGGITNNIITIWDATTYKPIHPDPLKQSGGNLVSVAFSHDSRRIVTGNANGLLKVWDVSAGRELLTFQAHVSSDPRHPSQVQGVAFSPNDSRIVTGSGEFFKFGEIKVWNAAGGIEPLTLRVKNAHMLHDVAFSPDNRHVASGSWNNAENKGKGAVVTVWDVKTGKQVHAFEAPTFSAWSVAFSPDGKRLLGGYSDHAVRVWDVTKGEEVMKLTGHTDAVHSVAYSRDGSRIVSSAREIKMWDAATGNELLDLKGDPSGVLSVAFNPDGSRILAGGRGGSVTVWDAATGKEVLKIEGEDRVWRVAFSPDGKRIATCHGAARDTGSLKVLDAATGKELLILKGHTSRVACAAFSPDGRRIVTGSVDRTIKVWDSITGHELLALSGQVAGIAGIAFSSDGKRIVSGSADGTVRVWDAARDRREVGEAEIVD